MATEFRQELALVKGASHAFDRAAFLAGTLTPVYCGSALNNFGVRELLDAFAAHAPLPGSRAAVTRVVEPQEPQFSGFVFKIQANMDPQHRDRIAFLRICSGKYKAGMRMHNVRLKKDIQVRQALTFMAGQREQVDEAYPGDILGLHNHGSIQIGDTFTQGEDLKFKGIPHFAPELFQSVRSADPLKMKALQKGLIELSEEGATQIFKPLKDNRLILGAIGILQFDVIAHRLRHEYGVDCVYDAIAVSTARWIECADAVLLKAFEAKTYEHLALDGGNKLAYLAPTQVNLQLTQERWPDIQFLAIREQ